MKYTVCHVITRFINGGADENTLHACNWSAEQGHDVILIYGAAHSAEIIGKINPKVRAVCISDLVRNISPLQDIKALRALTRLFRQVRPDIVHTHTSKAGIVGRLAARRAGVPVIVHGIHIAPFQNVDLLQRSIYLALETLCGRWTDAFISVSEGMRQAYADHDIGPPERHHVIHSGMPLAAFQKAEPPADWRELLGLGPDEPKPPVLVMLAAMEPRKRHAELIAVMGRVFEKHPTVRLVFGGDGKGRAAVEAAARSSGHADNIRILGFYPRPAALLAMADIGILCSTKEGLPRVVVQYTASGVPTIVSDLPGISEIVDNGQTGIVTSATEMSEIADELLALLDDPQRLAAMREACLARDLSSWTFEAMCSAQEDIYQSLLQANAQP